MQKKGQLVLLHIIGSLLFLSIPIISSPDLKLGTGMLHIAPFLRSFILYILLIGFFYANYFYIIPCLYLERRYLKFAAAVILSFLVVSIIPLSLIQQDIPVRPEMPPSMPPAPPRPGFVPHMEGGSFFLFLLVFGLSFLLRINQRLYNVQDEKQKAELSYLKAQINPHFLFNTLNSLYALTLDKSDAAPDAVLKLSAMMRYITTESSREFVPLEKELDYIRNYISLQQLRMDSGTQLNFSIKGATAAKNIAPLILIPFIENAFKYGINPEEDSDIYICIETKEDELKLSVKNKKVAVLIPEEQRTGKGIANTKQRLHHLYPKKHKLSIFDNDDTFEVKLILNLQ